MVIEKRHGLAPNSPPGGEPDPAEGRRSYARIPQVLDPPHLLGAQLVSWEWFLGPGLAAVLQGMGTVTDRGGVRLSLRYVGHSWGEPRYPEPECRDQGMTYAAPLRARVELTDIATGEVREQEVHLCDVPQMTPKGTFITNGSERVVVAQLVRAPGMYFRQGERGWGARLSPARGAWIEYATAGRDVVYAHLDRNRRLPATLLLRAVAALDPGVDPGGARLEPGTTPWLHTLLSAHAGEGGCLEATLEKDPTKNCEEALRELYRRARPGEPIPPGRAEEFLRRLLLDPRRYDLGRVGRFRVTARWLEEGLPVDPRALDPGYALLTGQDVLNALALVLRLNAGDRTTDPDETDHLGNKRVRLVGELLANAVRVGLARMEKLLGEALTYADPHRAAPRDLVDPRPLASAVREFFNGFGLSQYLDQINALSGVSHLRRLSSLGPGGLSVDSASMDARDVHHSHYGRICPIESPEGANIGLIGQMACYGRVNQFGFVETPYRKVVSELTVDDLERLVGQVLRQDLTVRNLTAGDLTIPAGTELDLTLARAICRVSPGARVPVEAVVSEEVEYLSADREDRYTIAQADSPTDERGRFLADRVMARRSGSFVSAPPHECRYMDASPQQMVGVGTALIPFLAHDDANRALMGANMMRQAVPLLSPQAPLVGTGMERQVARDSGQVVVAQADGVARSVTATRIAIEEDGGGVREYALEKWTCSNAGTSLNQRPAVARGERVGAGQVIADSPSTDAGELALGQNVLVAYLSWYGQNMEDGIVVSERLVRGDVYTSVHAKQFEVRMRDTHLGPEELTREIPDTSDESRAYLDARGIIKIGAPVKPGCILIGKVTPKGEATELTAEERFLRAVLEQRERPVKDASLRAGPGIRGTVIDVRVFRRDAGDPMPPDVREIVRVRVAKKRKIGVGDKLAGRHGNKGVCTIVVPVEDMPYTADGRVIDICLNPLGVPSRMNLGQLLEVHLGLACERLGWKVGSPVFDGATEGDVREAQRKAGIPQGGKMELFDGKTGEPFDHPVTVGVKYVMKLNHLADEKWHARSTGPNGLLTQQPLGGKSQFGGQRLGEMEVWALEGYGAAHLLREMLTVKSDDVEGRAATYHAITRGLPLPEGRTPEGFKVLRKELAGLGLVLQPLDGYGNPVELAAAGAEEDLTDPGVNLSRRERDLDPERGR